MKKQELLSQFNSLNAKIKALEAQLVHNYHFSEANVDKCSTDRLMGSAVIIQLTTLYGKKLIEPTAIRNGLSTETIESLKDDFRRSYDEAIEFKPRKKKNT